MVLLVENADDDRAKAAARVLGKRLKADPVFASVLGELPPFDMQQIVAPYLDHRFSLLSDADREALSQPDFDPAQMLARHLNEPFAATVGTALQDDPFGWLQHWMDGQPWSRSELMPEDNLLSAHRDGRNYVLVTATLDGSSYDDGIQRRALATLDAAEQTIKHDYPGTTLLRTGAVFYAASARAGAEHDVHLVGWVSSIGIALLMLLAFRSPGPLLFAFLSTAVGVIAATTVTLLVFGKIYLLTLVFGAALLGEAVDYSIQYLTARANAGAAWEPRAGLRQVRGALLLALATSVMGYALLGLVPFPALQQMACFAMSGMLAACVSVFWLLPALLHRPARPLSPALVRGALAMQTTIARLGQGSRGLWLAGLLLLIAAPGWWQLRHDDDVHLLISPPPALDAQEREIRSVTGLGNGSQFYLVQGDSIEQTLEREEALEQRLQAMVQDGSMQGWLGLAGMVPSKQRQEANRALLAPWMSDPARMRKILTDGGFRSEAIDSLAGRVAGPADRTHQLAENAPGHHVPPFVDGQERARLRLAGAAAGPGRCGAAARSRRGPARRAAGRQAGQRVEAVRAVPRLRQPVAAGGDAVAGAGVCLALRPAHVRARAGATGAGHRADACRTGLSGPAADPVPLDGDDAGAGRGRQLRGVPARGRAACGRQARRDVRQRAAVGGDRAAVVRPAGAQLDAGPAQFRPDPAAGYRLHRRAGACQPWRAADACAMIFNHFDQRPRR